MSKKIKKIILSLIISVIAILNIQTSSLAYNIGDIVNVWYGDPDSSEWEDRWYTYTEVTESRINYAANNNLYCAERAIDGGWAGQPWDGANYKIIDFVNIEGDKATNSAGEEVTNKANLQLAYILSRKTDGTYKHHTAAANGLWKYMSTWMEQVGNKLWKGLYLQYGEANQEDLGARTVKESEQYAERISGFKFEDKTNTNNIIKKIVTDSNVQYFKVGPFNWSFSGSLAEIKVYNQNNSAIGGIRYSQYNGNNEVFVDINNIITEKDFYIYIPVSSGTTKINRISAKSNIKDVYNVKIWLLKTLRAGNWQHLIIAEPSNGSKDLNVNFDYNIPLIGTLKIGKFDKSTGSSFKQGEATFKLAKIEGNSLKWIKKGNDGTYSYTTKADATQFAINNNGEVVIQNLPVGTYNIYETTTKAGYVELSDELIYKNVNVTVDIVDKYDKLVQMTYNIVASSEAKTVNSKLSTTDLVGKFYLAILGRAARGNEATGWVNIMNDTNVDYNTRLRNVIVGLVTSEEFKKQSITETTVNNYIKRLYNIMLSKKANGETVSQYLTRIASGKDYDKNGEKVYIRRPSNAEIAEHRYKGYNGYTGVAVTNIPVKLKIVKKDTTRKDTSNTDFNHDANGATLLPNVGFKLMMKNGNNWVWVYQKGETKSYCTNENDATVFKTNKNGEIIISGLRMGEYKIKEVINPNKGYEEKPNTITNITLNPKTSDLASGQSVITITSTIENKVKYIDISGYVWEDAHWSDGKGFVGNSLYKEGTMDANDKLVPNINVYLRKVTGTNQNEHVMNTKTDANGKYEFKNVKIDELNKYYIVFEYNGVLYKSVDEINTNKANGSKAKEGTTGGKSAREEFNKKFTTIVPGQALDANGNKTKDLKYETTQVTNVFDGSQSNESKILYNNSYDKVSDAQKVTGYPITGVDREYLIQSDTSAAYGGYLDKIYTADYIRKNGITKIENINQGLIERVQPSLTVGEDIYSARVEFNGESHIYEYSKRGEFTKEYTEDGIKRYGPTVKFEKGDYQKLSYVRAMYASDIKKAEGNEATLSLHVTYAIKITNGSGKLNIKVNQIADYFDSKYLKALRYGTTVNDKGIPQNAKTITEGQVQDINGVSTYKKAVLDVNLEIEAEKEGTVYVEFEVNPSEIYKVVNKTELVKLDNIVEINSYAVTDENKKPYAGICINSQPGNLKIEDPEDATIKFNNTYECDTAYAPGLTLTLQEARSTSGKVFLDETTGELKQGGVRQGDGICNDSEKGIKEVKVQLVKSNGELAQVYDENAKEWNPAEATTNDSGEYTISGFIPGEYTIQYTWGDKTYKVQDYKSTIVDEDVWRDNETNKEWYKDTEPRRSDAVDDYGTREEIDNQVKDVTYATQSQIDKYEDGVIGGSDLIDNITASTQPLKVNIEYITSKTTADGTAKTTVDDEYETAQNGVTIPKDGFKNRIEKIDFGIVERARQILDLNKRITNIKITLANGSELINTKVDKDGNFSNPTQYIVYLPESSDTAQVKVEIDSEIVQGATLELTYDLNVTNISEKEYATEEFYKYGKGHGETNIVKLTPSKIIDYLDNNINPEVGTGWEYVAETDKTELVEKYLWSGNSEDSESDTHKKQILKAINGTSKVVTTDKLGEALEPGQSTNGENSDAPITIVGYKLLSNNEETVLENNAEIIQVTKTGGSTLKTTPGNYIPGETPTEQREPDDATSERLSIIPPTGNGVNYISYIILAISLLGIIVAGIILIKKYVLKK